MKMTKELAQSLAGSPKLLRRLNPSVAQAVQSYLAQAAAEVIAPLAAPEIEAATPPVEAPAPEAPKEKLY